MIKAIKTTQSNDWTLTQLNESDAIQQNIKTALQSINNDWFLDYSHGLDIELITSQPYQDVKDLVKYIIITTIENVNGVEYIDKYSQTYNQETRRLEITASYIDIYNNKLTIKQTI